MSERPTPETDALAASRIGMWQHNLPADFSRSLERQRDEALDLARELREACELMIIGICAAAIPHSGERATASLAVSEARKALAKAKEVLP